MTFDLRAAYLHKQEVLSALLGGATVVNHPTDMGDIAENNWRELLASILPTRYEVTKATVVDSRGGMSHALDLVIHDRHFSPLVFRQDGVVYVPAESVYAVFEVKQELNKANLDYASTKASSVRALHRTSAAVPHAAGLIESPKAPPPILSGLLVGRSGWVDPLGRSFRRYLPVSGAGRLDLGCVASSGAWEVGFETEPQVTTVDVSISLVFFMVRLLARLQIMGSVPAMDYEIWGSSLATQP